MTHSCLKSVKPFHDIPDKKLYFCIIDIDDFKSVNDTYGHEFGNTVLINLAKELQNINQSNIFVARYGGEEFGILFADYEYTEAYNIINDIRIKFNNIKYENIPQQFTFSGGITEYKKNCYWFLSFQIYKRIQNL